MADKLDNLKFYEVFIREQFDGGSASQVVLDNENLEVNIKKFLFDFYENLIVDCDKMIVWCEGENETHMIGDYNKEKQVYIDIFNKIAHEDKKDDIIAAANSEESDWSVFISEVTVMT